MIVFEGEYTKNRNRDRKEMNEVILIKQESTQWLANPTSKTQLCNYDFL